ncbi:MAG TPA: PadR family transcriptional regulator [Acidocella sp.]|nr:PadR family transcriptional regulator [Acidocella sp.]
MRHHFNTICADGMHHDRRFMRREGGHRRGGPGGRLLEHGDLRLLVMHLIHAAPRHGYELIKAIEDLTGGAYAPSPGVIYPTLTMLEELGHVRAETDGTKRLFSLTEAGKAALEQSRPALDAMLARLSNAPSREAIMPVKRAMENLKTALRMKLGGRTADPAAISKVTDMIDELVRKIEAI